MATAPLPIAATIAYRSAVALAVSGAAPQPIAETMGFGSGSTPYSPDDDTALENQFSQALVQCTADGPMLTVKGVLTGTAAGANTLREVGVFASDGTLMARRTVAPKQLEPDTEFEFEFVFEY